MGNWVPRLCLSGVLYHRIHEQSIPPGFVSLPVKVNESWYGDGYEAEIIAGSVGMQVTSSGELGVAEPAPDDGFTAEANLEIEPTLVGLESVQPVSGWFMFKVKPVDPTWVPWEMRW